MPTWVVVLLAVVAAIVVGWYRKYRAGNPRFWRLAARLPDKAYDWFKQEECWVVVDPQMPGGPRGRPGSDYAGPFMLSVPKLGWRVVKIYGRHDQIEDSERRFMEKYQAKGDARREPEQSDQIGDSQLSKFLKGAGDKPYRRLVAYHLRRQSTAELQRAGTGEVLMLPEHLQSSVLAYIDAVNARLGHDKHFWETATCRQAFDALIDIALQTLFLRGLIDSVDDALHPRNHELAFQLFQIPTLNLAYSASTQRSQRKFMGIRKGIFG